MTIRFVIKKNVEKKKRVAPDSVRVTVYVRLKDGVGIDQMCRTPILVNPLWWDYKRESVNDFAECSDPERSAINCEIQELRRQLASKYVVAKIKGPVGTDWLHKTIEEYQGDIDGGQKLLLETFQQFISKHAMSDTRKKQYQAMGRMLMRYEMFESHSRNATRIKHHTVSSVTPEILTNIYEYIKNEDQLFLQHPEYYDDDTASNQTPKPRSQNTMSDIFKKLRTFFKWCVSTGLISKSPFDDFHVDGELYGTPIYLTQEEISRILAHNFYRHPNLARQRDIFIFQCNVGCRVGDLIRLRKIDVVDDQITYIPQKTRAERPKTVTVPLNNTAKAIVRRYASDGREELLPFISPQKYNMAIKQVLEKSGITRMVTVLDPLTRMDKKVRICDIGSSHMARRTFAGNIYKKVKDPALVASLTGHTEGSKAFARYRDIDDEMKRELVELLE